MELSLAVILGKMCYFQDYLALHIMKAFLDRPEDFLAHPYEQVWFFSGAWSSKVRPCAVAFGKQDQQRL